MLDISKDNLEALKEEATLVKPETLIRYIRVFSEAVQPGKVSHRKSVLWSEYSHNKAVQAADGKGSYDSVLDRINSIEKKLEKGIPVAAQAMQTQDMQQAAASGPVVKKELPKAIPQDIVRAHEALEIHTFGDGSNIKGLSEQGCDIARQFL